MKQDKEMLGVEDELSLFQITLNLLNEFKIWFSLFKRNLKFFCIAALLGSIFGFTYAYRSVPTYDANLTFLMGAEGGSNLMNSLSSLSSFFPGVGSLGNSTERVMNILKSDNVLFNSLFKKVNINEKNDYLINHFIYLENLDKVWKNDINLSNVLFDNTIKTINDLSYHERKVFKLIKQMLIPVNGEGIISTVSNKNTGIVKIITKHIDENFAIELTNSLYNQLLLFYTNNAKNSSNNTLEVLIKRADSIQIALNEAQDMAARNKDQTLGLILQENKVESKRLAIKEQMLNMMNLETQKNLEAIKILNESASPTLTLLDYPYSPIIPNVKSKVLYTIFGFFLFTFLYLIILRFRIIYKKLYEIYS